MNETPRLDGVGVPTYFITDVINEDAGHGIARIWNCSLQGGVLVPECKIIVHSSRLLRLGKQVSDYALTLYQRAEMENLMVAGRGH